MNQSEEGQPVAGSEVTIYSTWTVTGAGDTYDTIAAPRQRAVGPDDSIRDTKPILEDSIRGALRQMSDEELQAASDWSNSWTTDHVSAVKRWVARGPINDEIDRRSRSLPVAPIDRSLGDKKTD